MSFEGNPEWTIEVNLPGVFSTALMKSTDFTPIPKEMTLNKVNNTPKLKILFIRSICVCVRFGYR